MSQPVKLSDALILDARIAGEVQERSIGRQVEFWAKLGRSVELLLGGKQVLALCRSAGAAPLSQLADAVDTAKGHRNLKAYLASEPFPHYEPYPGKAGFLIRTKEDGSKVVGKFVNRIFVLHSSEFPIPANRKVAFSGNVKITRVKIGKVAKVHEKIISPPIAPVAKKTDRGKRAKG